MPATEAGRNQPENRVFPPFAGAARFSTLQLPIPDTPAAIAPDASLSHCPQISVGALADHGCGACHHRDAGRDGFRRGCALRAALPLGSVRLHLPIQPIVALGQRLFQVRIITS